MKHTNKVLGMMLIVALMLFYAAEPVEARSRRSQRGRETQTATPSAEAYPPYSGVKQIIAVSDFDSVWQVGHGSDSAILSAMLAEELVNCGRFIVVERRNLDDILAEQELSAAGMTTEQTMVRAGNLLGAALLVRGTVTKFEEVQSASGGGVSVPLPGIPIVRRGTVGGRSTTGEVAVNLRLMDTTSGQLINSHTAAASVTSQKTSLGTRGYIGMSFSEFKQTALSDAAHEAIRKAVMFIIGETETLPITARVAAVRDGNVYLNAGTNRNVLIGMRWGVYKTDEEIVDPDTGLVIDVIENRIGAIQVTSVRDQASTATPFEGTLPEVGDTVRLE